MLQPQKVEAIYKNGVLHPLEPLEGFVEHCKVNITVDYEGMPPHPEEAQGKVHCHCQQGVVRRRNG